MSASAGLRMATSGPMATPRTRTAMTMTTRTSTGSFFSTVVHHSGGCAARAPRLSRLSSACSVIQRDGYLPGRGVNTPPMPAGPAVCACGLERCSRPGVSGRSRPTLQPAAALQAAISHGPDRTLPRHALLPRVGEVAWSTGLVVSIGSTGAAPAMSTAAGRPAGPAARPGSNGTMSPRWSSALRGRQRPANGSGHH